MVENDGVMDQFDFDTMTDALAEFDGTHRSRHHHKSHALNWFLCTVLSRRWQHQVLMPHLRLDCIQRHRSSVVAVVAVERDDINIDRILRHRFERYCFDDEDDDDDDGTLMAEEVLLVERIVADDMDLVVCPHLGDVDDDLDNDDVVDDENWWCLGRHPLLVNAFRLYSLFIFRKHYFYFLSILFLMALHF